MTISLNKSDFYEIIQKSIPIVPVKSSLQVLSNFKLTAENGVLSIIATDLDHSIRLEKKINGNDLFEITINARKLSEIARELPDGDIFIKVDENVLSIVSDNGFKCKIAGTDASDFPAFPEVSEERQLSISVEKLKNMVEKSSFAVSKEESRACLKGILWEIESSRTGMVATDGHRLGSCFYADTFSISNKISSIISQKTLIHLVKTLADSDSIDAITVSFGEKYILFSTADMVLCSKLIEGQYPDYEKAIPRNNPKNAIVDKKSLAQAVRRVSVLSNQKTHLIKCSFAETGLEVAALNRDIGGEAHESVPIEYAGEEHTIGFNAQYISEIIGIISTEKVKFEMNTQISACLLLPQYEKEDQKKSDDLFLIMPLRIMEEL